jgi:stage IV sporulation protein FB
MARIPNKNEDSSDLQGEGREMTAPSPLSTSVAPATGSSYGGGEVRVGRLFGIPLRLHWSFLLFVGWLVFDGLRYGPAGMLDAIGWTSMLFGSVLIHELAHALVGRARGVAVEDIILLPIGGATRLTKLGDGARANLAMTAAGPLTSLALAATAGMAAFVTRAALFPVDIHHGTVIGRLFWLNLILGLFNLLPLFPMDGGRILQGLLSPRMGDRRSTIVAATVGQVLAAGLVILGLTGNLWLVVIGFYLFVEAGREAGAATERREWG